MSNYISSILLVLSLIIVLNAARAGAESKVHIVYLGEKQHHDPEFVTESHHQMLASLLGSKKDAHDSMVYSYRHGFSGFAAKRTKSQAKKIAGLSAANPKMLVYDTNMGDQVIIGVIDTGVWPESESFNDDEVGPIPRQWKGGCESGENFISTNCNRKLIGAKYFIKGFLAKNKGFNSKKSPDYISARDFDGHGTHVASIAGGSFVPNVSYKGLAGGTLRGGAPRCHARIMLVSASF